MPGMGSAVDERIGKTVAGKYLLVRVLGSGGMGKVYEARNAVFGKRVALKLIHFSATRTTACSTSSSTHRRRSRPSPRGSTPSSSRSSSRS